MAIRSKVLWRSERVGAGENDSPAVPAGHVYIVKQIVLRSQTPISGLAECGAKDAALGRYYDWVNMNANAGGVIQLQSGFFVVEAPDVLFLYAGGTGTLHVSFYGADLS